jgi:hypothetical protein|tara:strand:- start:248 stop:526 length:279 start_codon:yes stop_codon:yes gene_type:complete
MEIKSRYGNSSVVGDGGEEDEDALAEREANQMCGSGSLLLGIGLGFLSALCSSIVFKSGLLTTMAMSFGSAIGSLGSVDNDILAIKKQDFGT